MGNGSEGVRLTPVAKPGGVRWLTRLDPARAAVYAGSVAPAVPAIERALTPGVVANRVAVLRRHPPEIRLEPWQTARARFRALAADLASGSDVILLADVRACYAAITPERVEDALIRLGCRRGIARGVAATVRAFERSGVVGLPVGPEPSAVLANAVLAHVDESLGAGGFRHLRWVDDVLVAASDPSSAASALGIVESALGEIGLTVAAEKTRVLEPSTDSESRWLLLGSCSPSVRQDPMDG